MSVLPITRLEQIQFCEYHVPIWTAAPTTIGLTAGQVTALDTATKAARAAYTASQAARQAAKASTTTFYSNTTTMRNQAADLIRQVKAYAELQSNPAKVYGDAQIDMPLPPTPQPAPGKPDNMNVNLEPSGAITLSWEATDASASSGAFYNVMRKLPGQSAFVGVGGAPGSTVQSRRMSFTDYTVPTSAAAVGAQYIIQGRRGSLVGDPSDAITVQFGVDGGGLTVTSAAGNTFKMAA